MNQPSTLKYAKLAMIPVLCGVLYSVFPRSKPTIVPNDSNSSSVVAASPPKPKRAEPKAVSATIWPSFDVSELTAANPFDRSRLFPELAAMISKSSDNTSTDTTLVSTDSAETEIENRFQIQAIFHSSRGVAALVNDRTIHVGDRLEDGSEVIGIMPDRLLLAPREVH